MHRRVSRRVFIGLIAAVAAVITSLNIAAVGGAAPMSSCVPLPSSSDKVHDVLCLNVNNNPNPVSRWRPAAPDCPFPDGCPSTGFLSNDVTITNTTGQKITQLKYTLGPVAPALAASTFAFHALPTKAILGPNAVTTTIACSYSSQVITCLPPPIPDDGTLTFSIPLKSPTSTGQVKLTSTLSFKESGSPDPGRISAVPPIQDTITVSETGATATSAVPESTLVQLSVGKNGQGGKANIPGQKFATTANVFFTPTTEGGFGFFCPSGQVCREGDWLGATIPFPQGASTFNPPIRITGFWTAKQVPSDQTESNFAIYYLAEPGGTIQTVSARCETSVPPCITDVTEVKQGPLKGWFATLVLTDHNGYMK